MKTISKKSKVGSSVLFLIITTILISCSNTENAFNQAKETNTIEAYESYMAKYPKSEYYAQAKMKAAKLSYERAKEINTKESYRKFIAKYGNSSYSEEAGYRMDLIHDFMKLNLNYESYVIYNNAMIQQVLSADEFKSRFNWNGEKVVWNWSNEAGYVGSESSKFKLMMSHDSPENGFAFNEGHRRITGKTGLGNILFDGKWQWVFGKGIEIEPQTIIIYPK